MKDMVVKTALPVLLKTILLGALGTMVAVLWPDGFRVFCGLWLCCANQLTAELPLSPDGPMPNSTFIDRQVWMAASLQVCCRPRLPFGTASQFIPGSNQIVSEPRHLSASLQAGQFVALQIAGVGLLMPPGCHPEFTR